jgi:hypothetical protein
LDRYFHDVFSIIVDMEVQLIVVEREVQLIMNREVKTLWTNTPRSVFVQ